MLRRVCQIVAILAVIHVVVVGGLGVFLWMRGTLSAVRVERIAAVLRGEYEQPGDAPRPVSTHGAPTAELSAEAVARREGEEDRARFRSERTRVELQQQLALVTREMIRVREERERFEAERARESEAAKKQLEQTQQAGFQKQLEYFESLKPAAALELLLGREEEEAADLLKIMDTRKGRKIIEAAKTPAQRKKLDGIMRLLPELDMNTVSAEAPKDRN